MGSAPAASGPDATSRAAGAAADWADRPVRVSVLGATGSIGTSTLDVIGRNPDAFEVIALTANSNADRLAELAIRHRARIAVVADAKSYADLKRLLAGTGIEAGAGDEALEVAASRAADCVVAGIVGAAGLRPTFAAVAQGTRVALANKECLVTAGHVFMRAVETAGAELIPVDSEHSGAFQAIAGADVRTIEKITLTASGGPFRDWPQQRLAAATVEEALRHPNWSMGPKITIDSATLMNKGLELIEAFHLFGVEPRQLDVVVHPQSIVHCLVSYRDGSVLAQLGSPDMRTPIAYSLSFPARMPVPTQRLDLVSIGALTFEAPDAERFPALGLARAAMQRGGAAPAVLNAANEVAVQAFLSGRIGFLDITGCVATCLDVAEGKLLAADPASLEQVIELDCTARELARQVIDQQSKSGLRRSLAQA